MSSTLTFDEFCFMFCDKLYNPMLHDTAQCTGYHELKKMVMKNISPATLEEMKDFEEKPTFEQLFSAPDIKYLRFLHPNVRPFVVKHWEIIKNLKIDVPEFK
jgi:hypothetical protein